MNIAEELDKTISEIFKKEPQEDPRQKENTKVFIQELRKKDDETPEVGDIYEVDENHHFCVVSKERGEGYGVMAFSPIDVPGTNGDLLFERDRGHGLRTVLTWTNMVVSAETIQQFRVCGKLASQEVEDLKTVFVTFNTRMTLDPNRFGWRVGSASADSAEDAKLIGHWMFERTIEWRTILA